MTPKEANKYISKLKKEYPDATKMTDKISKKKKVSEYCVGGVLGKSLSKKDFENISARPICPSDPCFSCDKFPSAYALEDIIIALNDRIDIKNAHRFAEAIITLNDDGCIEKAWEVAEEALCYPEKPLKEDEE